MNRSNSVRIRLQIRDRSAGGPPRQPNRSPLRPSALGEDAKPQKRPVLSTAARNMGSFTRLHRNTHTKQRGLVSLVLHQLTQPEGTDQNLVQMCREFTTLWPPPDIGSLGVWAAAQNGAFTALWLILGEWTPTGIQPFVPLETAILGAGPHAISGCVQTPKFKAQTVTDSGVCMNPVVTFLTPLIRDRSPVSYILKRGKNKSELVRMNLSGS